MPLKGGKVGQTVISEERSCIGPVHFPRISIRCEYPFSPEALQHIVKLFAFLEGSKPGGQDEFDVFGINCQSSISNLSAQSPGF